MRHRIGTRRGLAIRSMSATALVLVVMFGQIAVAEAKGPESLTIHGPGTEEPIELTRTDVPWVGDDLMGLTGLWSLGVDAVSPVADTDLGPQVILSWVNSGPPGLGVEERTIHQFVYPRATGGPVIHTPAQDGLDGWGIDVIGWFAAPADLADVLEELGVSITETEMAEPETHSPDPVRVG